MSELKNVEIGKYNISAGKKSILNLLSQREKGILRNSQYKSDCTNIKVNHLPNISDCFTVFTDFDDGYYWPYLRTDARGNIIVVCWKSKGDRHNRDSAICVCKFDYCSENEDTSNSWCSFVKDISKTYQIFQNMMIADTADLCYQNQNPLLVVGQVKSGENKAIMTSYHNNYVQQEYEWRVDSFINCCSSVKNSENFSLGCDDGFYICNNLRLSKKYHFPESIIAAEFNDDGNLLLVSSNCGGIQLCDMREDIDKRRRFLPPYIKERALDDSSVIAYKMKLLFDQVTLIVSDESGQLSKVDLRMRKCVFQYPHHKSVGNRKHLGIDEDLDLLCAVENDRYCRIWSLGTGKLNWCTEIVRSSDVDKVMAAHACIVSSERRWFVAVVQNAAVLPIVPDEADIMLFNAENEFN